MPTRRIAATLMAAGALAFWSVPASAATYTWTGATDSDFSLNGNWDTAGFPTTNDIARFNTTDNADLSVNAASEQIQVTAGNTATLNLNSLTFTLNANNINHAAGALGLVNTATLILNGPGTLNSWMGTDYNQFGNLTVQNGAVFDQANINGRVFLQGGSTWTATGTGSVLSTDSSIHLVGGVLSAADGATINIDRNLAGRTGGIVNVGGGSGTSTLAIGLQLLTTDFADSAVADIRVQSNGVMTVAGTGANRLVATHYENTTLTLVGGTVGLGAGSTTAVERNTSNPSPGTFINSAIRGHGTIQKLTGGVSNFVINSDGFIRPGDTSGTAAIGTLNLVNGNLNQSSVGTMFLNFNGTSSDLINITGGSANIAGTISFSILDGYMPQARDVWNFVIADSITYTGTSNVGTVLANAGYMGFYTFGVITRDGQQFLQLALPEPASMGLLAAGVLLVLTRRRA